MKKFYFVFTLLSIIGISQLKAQCTADFLYFANGPFVGFQDSSSFPPSSTINYLWDFGDGNSSSLQNPSHNYGLAGTYYVCLVISDSAGLCADTICKVVNASSGINCTASFTYLITNNNTVAFTNTSTPNAAYSWNFGDGSPISTINNPTHTYISPGTYTVTLMGQSTGGQCTTSVNIVINSCTADFSSSVGSNGIVNFTNNSSPNHSQVAFAWNFGDGSPLNGSINPIHTYTTSGIYAVNLNLYDSLNNCSASYTDSIVVNIGNPSSCNASYTIAKDSSVAFGVILYNTSSNYGSHYYAWDFGDGITGSGRVPSHQYQSFGSYQVCLTITDNVLNCTSTFCDTVGMDTLGNLKAGFGLTVVEASVVGIEEHEKSLGKIQLKPNPAKEKLILNLRSVSTSVQYKILDLTGKEVLKGFSSEVEENINLVELEKGVYFIILNDGISQVTKKFIKI